LPTVRSAWTTAAPGTPGFHPFVDGHRDNQLLVDCDLIVGF